MELWNEPNSTKMKWYLHWTSEVRWYTYVLFANELRHQRIMFLWFINVLCCIVHMNICNLVTQWFYLSVNITLFCFLLLILFQQIFCDKRHIIIIKSLITTLTFEVSSYLIKNTTFNVNSMYFVCSLLCPVGTSHLDTYMHICIQALECIYGYISRPFWSSHSCLKYR